MTAHNAVSSNAFNTTSFISNGVDPRTGQYTATINLPAVNGNFLNGPSLPLALSFSPINTQDSGFGVGWDLPLSQFNPTTRVLALSTGESYKVTGSGPTPQIAEQRLDSFKFYDEGGRRYRVVHKSGLVEVLELQGISGHLLALPVQIHGPQGHQLTLSYQSYGNFQRLHEVRQADGTPLLRLQQGASSLSIDYLAGTDSQVLATFLLQIQSGKLTQLMLPTAENARWRFEYDTFDEYSCIKSVRSPHGALETVEHESRHLFPNNRRSALPRVSRHLIDPGREQPRTELRFTYSENNFLGYGARGLTFVDDGLDNLYRVTEAYEYSSTKTHWVDGVAGQQVQSTYNRYHLLTEQITTQGNSRQINSTEYALDESLPFDLQVAQCQLPHKVIARWTLVDDPTRLRDEVQTCRFDAFGNMIEQVDPSGVRQTWVYYAASGEPGCPPDPYGFCRQLKEHRRYPAPQPPANGPRQRTTARIRTASLSRCRSTPRYLDDPVLITRYTYKPRVPLAGGPVPTLVVDACSTSAETAAGERPLSSSEQHYYDCPQQPERHGLPHTRVEDHGGYRSTLTFEYDFASHPGELTLRQQVVHDFDASSNTSYQRTDLYTGLMVEQHTAEGRVLRYEYDALRRLIGDSVMAADARFPASRRFSYSWPTATGRYAEHRTVDAEGVETVDELDGLGRTVRQLRQRADGSADDSQLRVVSSSRYDAHLRLLEHSNQDWLDTEPLVTTEHYEYDDWGQCCRVTDSRGIATYTVTDPFELTVTTWQDGLSPTVTRNNLHAKPESITTFAAQPVAGQSWLSRERFFYDGHGQLRLHLGTSGGATRYHYDSFGRTLRTRLPDSTCIERQYAEHTSAALVTGLEVVPGQQAAIRQRLGSQRFDGLERLTRQSVGPRTTEFLYRGNLDVLEQRITAGQQAIRFDYDLGLSNAPTATHADDSCTFEYHPVTAALTLAQSAQGTLEYQYDRGGQLIRERSESNGRIREISYRKSAGGRLLEQVESYQASQLQTRLQYDDQGRTRQLNEGQVQANFEYNQAGQLSRTTVQDLTSGNTQVTELEYDALGRETLRTQRLTGSAEQRTRLTWAVDGHLRHRELSIGGALSLRESFVHDLRGRLVEHRCSGPDLPLDPYGNGLTCQQFDFDGLDNLVFCTSFFLDGSEDEAHYRYAEDDPCQLRSLSHTHPLYVAETLFSYDADGNLQTDAKGRQLQYDRQGRLLQVCTREGAPLVRYRYDAHDHLMGVTRASDSETLRFYQGTQLRATAHGDSYQCLSYADDVPLGQQQLDDPAQTLLTLCDAGNSVFAQVKGQGQIERTRYTSHGDSSEVLDSALGFNGEVREQDTGWYLLGNGYRAYDPQLARFHSPDSESPFGGGGLNPYAYCLGDPVGRHDPTGHFANPHRAALLRRRANKEAAGKNALTTFLMGTAMNIGISILLAPVTGGASVSWMIVNEIELVATTLITYGYQKQGKEANWLQYYYAASVVLYFLMPTKLGSKAGSKAAGKIKPGQALENLVEEPANALAKSGARSSAPARNIEGGPWKRPRIFTNKTATTDLAPTSGRSGSGALDGAPPLIPHAVLRTSTSKVKPTRPLHTGKPMVEPSPTVAAMANDTASTPADIATRTQAFQGIEDQAMPFPEVFDSGRPSAKINETLSSARRAESDIRTHLRQ